MKHLEPALRGLYAEKAKLDAVIAALETMEEPRRGRKGMGAEEREAVRLRMRSYWARRRDEA